MNAINIITFSASGALSF